MAAVRSSSTRFFKNLVSNHRSATLSSNFSAPLSKTVDAYMSRSDIYSQPYGNIVTSAANLSTAAQQAQGQSLKNRPLSPFLSQKRPEKSSILSIGERMLLIGVGLAVLPAPEIAKMIQFMY